jgi:hypothetical protein
LPRGRDKVFAATRLLQRERRGNVLDMAAAGDSVLPTLIPVEVSNDKTKPANVAAVSALADRHALVCADRHVHHSLLAGVRASGARLVRFGHNDLEDLERRLAQVGALAGLERTRLLRWIAASAGLSAAGFLADGDPAAVNLAVARLALQRLGARTD